MVCKLVDGSPESQFRRAVCSLSAGGCVVYPTETFYALGAVVGSAESLARVNAIKGRPRSKPLPAIVGHRDQLDLILSQERESWPGWDAAQKLMDLFWPGPLSIVMPARKGLAPQLLDAAGCVSVRHTPHPQAQRLCLEAGSPLAATSANVSGQPAVNALDELSPAVCLNADFVLQGSPAPAGGMPSTVLRPEKGMEALVFRAGALPLDVLEKAGFRLTMRT